MRILAGCALAMLAGCGRVGETPISLNLSMEIEGTEDLPEGTPTDEVESQLIATDPLDLATARESIPKIARGITAIEALEISLASPELGPVGTWIDELQMYASADGELSDDDVDMGAYTLSENDDSLIIPITEEVNDMLTGDSLTLLIDISLRNAPEETIELPLTLDAVGYIKIF